MQRSLFESLKDLYKKAVIIVGALGTVLMVFIFVPSLSEATSPIGLPEIATICLSVGRLFLLSSITRSAKINYNAEDSMPHFIRDVTEANKIGFS